MFKNQEKSNIEKLNELSHWEDCEHRRLPIEEPNSEDLLIPFLVVK